MHRLRTTILTDPEGQAVLIPDEFRLDAKEVEIWRRGEELVVRPIKPARFANWEEMFAAIDARKADLTIDDRDQPALPDDRIPFDDE